MSTAEFAEKRAADANRPVPICSPLWGEEALSTIAHRLGSAFSELMTIVEARRNSTNRA
jgi:hypothetical protein